MSTIPSLLLIAELLFGRLKQRLRSRDMRRGDVSLQLRYVGSNYFSELRMLPKLHPKDLAIEIK